MDHIPSFCQRGKNCQSKNGRSAAAVRFPTPLGDGPPGMPGGGHRRSGGARSVAGGGDQVKTVRAIVQAYAAAQLGSNFHRPAVAALYKHNGRLEIPFELAFYKSAHFLVPISTLLHLRHFLQLFLRR